MQGQFLFIAIFSLFFANCFSQDEIPRPSFPDVFQTNVEGIFITEREITEIDGSLYYDRMNNRSALFFTYKGESTRSIYNFNSDEIISIDGNICVVDKIPDNPEESFFKFSLNNGTKILASPEEVLFFTNSVLDRQELSVVPTLIYTAKMNIPQYGRSNCEVSHVFTKPDVELPTCTDTQLCEPTLMTISVECKNEDGGTAVKHIYNFFRFEPRIVDESVFLPPAGVHCNMKSTKTFPQFPTYFSFTFDIVEKPKEAEGYTAVFTSHKEVWYDSEYKIIRVDEFDYNGLLFSSRIFDLKAATAFTIIATLPTCDMGPVEGLIHFDQITRLPEIFFAQNDSTVDKAVYVGKRRVNGLDYDVWSLTWTDKASNAMIVEEIYFLQVIPNRELNQEKAEPFLQISHVIVYTYEMNDETQAYDLTLLKYLSINNFRTKPKEWVAFDVAACFSNKEKKDFLIKLEGPSLIKDSQYYREVLELFYNKIVDATGVSVLRISELTGVFDGVKLIGIKGSILDNKDVAGWQKDNREPGMEGAFKLLKDVASEGKLSITFKKDNNEKGQFNVTSVGDLNPPPDPNNCFSGGAMAAAGLVLLLLGVFFGVAGYYVFLKKRKKANNEVLMSSIDTKYS